jgi:hypothetical protein
METLISVNFDNRIISGDNILTIIDMAHNCSILKKKIATYIFDIIDS